MKKKIVRHKLKSFHSILTDYKNIINLSRAYQP